LGGGHPVILLLKFKSLLLGRVVDFDKHKADHPVHVYGHHVLFICRSTNASYNRVELKIDGKSPHDRLAVSSVRKTTKGCSSAKIFRLAVK